jgi:hypothetical protein
LLPVWPQIQGLGLHALIGLAVLLRQIGPPDPHIDHLDAKASRAKMKAGGSVTAPR